MCPNRVLLFIIMLLLEPPEPPVDTFSLLPIVAVVLVKLYRIDDYMFTTTWLTNLLRSGLFRSSSFLLFKFSESLCLSDIINIVTMLSLI